MSSGMNHENSMEAPQKGANKYITQFIYSE